MNRRKSLQQLWGATSLWGFGALTQLSAQANPTSSQAPTWRAIPWDIGAAKAQSKEVDQNLIAQTWAYVDFWASWCTPCRLSFPFMNQLQSQFGRRGLKIIAISVDKDAKNLASFLRQQDPKFSILWDPDGSAAKAFDLKAMPNSFLINPAHQIVTRHLGFRQSDATELITLIDKQMATS